MRLKLICITVLLITILLTLVVFRITAPYTTVREIHHYRIHDAAVKDIMKELSYKHMQEILYGYKYDAPIFPPGNICFWWKISPYNLFNIFPKGAANYYYGNQEP